MNKKMIFYEVNPKFFKDYSGNGIGDIRGLANKMEYFKYLGIDALILPNILSTYSNDAIQDYKQLAKSYGTITDLQKVISIAKKQKTKIIVELNIGSIKETHKWFQNALNNNSTFEEIVAFKPNKKDELAKEEAYKYTNKTKSYYVINEKTQEVALNWSNEETMRKFVEVVKFWNDLGVNGFVFTNFEQIGYTGLEGKIMSDETLKELRKLYISIKEINDDIIVIGKSTTIKSNSGFQFTAGATKVFDYTQLTKISKIGTSLEYGNDVIGHFSQNTLVKEIRKLVASHNDILLFGSNETGRITSRWGDDGQYNAESAKALGLLLLSTPSSSSIYYGDELGSKNIGLTHLDNFNDATINERKRALADRKISEEKFMDAQVMQNPINANSLMAWNGTKNGGFSTSEKTIVPVSTSYRQINVATQYVDKNSPLNFYKRIIALSKTSSFKEIFNFGTYKISTTLLGMGVIKVIRKYKDKEIVIFVNLTNKPKSIMSPKLGGKVQLSTYGYKNYSTLPKVLDPFEGVIISKDSDESIRQDITQLVMKQKEELQKTREIELTQKNEVKEKILKEKNESKALAQKEFDRIALEIKKAKNEQIALELKEEDRNNKMKLKEKAKAIQEKEQLKAKVAKEKAKAIQEKERLVAIEQKNKLELRNKIEKAKEAENKTNLLNLEKEKEIHRQEVQKHRQEEVKRMRTFLEDAEDKKNALIKERNQKRIILEKEKVVFDKQRIQEKEKDVQQKELEKTRQIQIKEDEAQQAEKQKEIYRVEKEKASEQAEKQKEIYRVEKEKAAEQAKKQKELEKTRQIQIKEDEAQQAEKQKEIYRAEKEKASEQAKKQKEIDRSEKEKNNSSDKTKTFIFSNPFKKVKKEDGINTTAKDHVATKTVEIDTKKELSDDEIKEMEDFLK